MHLIVRESAIRPPIFTSNTASWAEIRDEEGNLVLAIIFPPGKSTVLVMSRKDQDFVQTVTNFGIPLQEVPPTSK